MEEHKECSICLEPIDENEEVKKLINCNHIFHKSCIDTWSNNNNTCPLCRKHIISLFFGSTLFFNCIGKKNFIIEVGENKLIFNKYQNVNLFNEIPNLEEKYNLEYYKIKNVIILKNRITINYCSINKKQKIKNNTKKIYLDNESNTKNFFNLLTNSILIFYKKYNIIFN